MAGHAYIQREDLGLTVLGTTQYSYTIDGVHHQDYDAAVCKASLCRVSALEEVASAYTELVRGREKKIEELGTALASIASAISSKDKPQTDDYLSIGSDAARILRNYGFDASSSMQYGDLLKLQQEVQYAMDTEDNEMQQDMTDVQNYVSKRDDAMQTVTDLMNKIAGTRQQGISYIGR